MTPRPDESYQSWAERVRMFEHGRAMQRIAQGDDVNTVMEDMARRIVDKMLHPIYRASTCGSGSRFGRITQDLSRNNV
jgi:glutamyl-tRNA reductase